MSITAQGTGTGGSETVEATEGLFAVSSQADNEGTAVQGVIKTHCSITDNTPVTSHHSDVVHNMRLGVLDTQFVSSKGGTDYNKQL